MENAILNLPPHQEQMVWLIDFQGFNLSHISVKVTRETAHVLQDHYPERLGLAILYNPPKFFEPFWTVIYSKLSPWFLFTSKEKNGEFFLCQKYMTVQCSNNLKHSIFMMLPCVCFWFYVLCYVTHCQFYHCRLLNHFLSWRLKTKSSLFILMI